MAPATTAWLKEAIARDHRINQALEKEWELLLASTDRGASGKWAGISPG